MLAPSMEISSPDTTGLVMSKRHQEIETNHERTKPWKEQKQGIERKAAVVYYLSRNGQLDHPHFMEVPLSSPQGLYLKDVTSTLNILRGQGMASMYSWSSKRSYRNGYVWQDLSGDDFIHPCHGHEYILKGSLLTQGSQSCRSFETSSSSSSSSKISKATSSSQCSDSPVYKAETTGEFAKQRTSTSAQTGNINENESLLAAKKLKIGKKEDEHQHDVEVHKAEDVESQRCGCDQSPSGRFRVSLLLLKVLGCGSRGF